jgi:hypothetical protein
MLRKPDWDSRTSPVIGAFQEASKCLINGWVISDVNRNNLKLFPVSSEEIWRYNTWLTEDNITIWNSGHPGAQFPNTGPWITSQVHEDHHLEGVIRQEHLKLLIRHQVLKSLLGLHHRGEKWSWFSILGSVNLQHSSGLCRVGLPSTLQRNLPQKAEGLPPYVAWGPPLSTLLALPTPWLWYTYYRSVRWNQLGVLGEGRSMKFVLGCTLSL